MSWLDIIAYLSLSWCIGSFITYYVSNKRIEQKRREVKVKTWDIEPIRPHRKQDKL